MSSSKSGKGKTDICPICGFEVDVNDFGTFDTHFVAYAALQFGLKIKDQPTKECEGSGKSAPLPPRQEQLW